MNTLNVIIISLFTVFVSTILYKYIVSRQRLIYDGKINIKLIIAGISIKVIVTLLVGYINYILIIFSLNTGLNQILLELFRSIITVTFIYFSLYYWVIKPKNYVNRYDISIYALCIGIGIGLSNVILGTIFIGGFSSFLMTFSQFMIPLGYTIVMAFFLVKVIEKDNKYDKWLVIFIPIAIIFCDNLLYMKKDLFGLLGNVLFDSIIYTVFTTLLLTAVRQNMHFEHIDHHNKLKFFSNRKTIQERISYRFDSLMSYGNVAVALVLLIIGIIGILIVTAIILIEAPEITKGSLSKALWLSFMRVLDPGNVASDPEFKNITFLIVTILATFFGLTLISTYIGLVSGSFSLRIEKLREGNAKVLDQNHILFLGFNDLTLSIISNILRNKSKKEKVKIVILSNKSRKQMEDKIFEAGVSTLNSKIICRTGELTSSASLSNAGIMQASKVIIIGDDDQSNIKIGMMVKNLLNSDENKEIDIMLMAGDKKESYLINALFNEKIKVYSNQDINFESLLKACSLKAFLKIYAILSGSKDDYSFSMLQIKECYGKSFGDILTSFTYSSLIGLIENDEIILNPNKAIIIKEYHKLIFLKSTGLEPDFTGKIKKRNENEVNAEEILTRFDNEVDIIKNLLIIGNSSQHILVEAIHERYPNIKPTLLNQLENDSVFCEIDKSFKTSPPDIIIFLGDKTLSDLLNDAICFNVLAYLNSKYSRKNNNYVIAARLNNHKDVKFAYEINVVDLVIENDLSRNIALDILDDHFMLSKIKEKLIKSDSKIKAISASKVINNNTHKIKILDIYHDCAKKDLTFIGYIKESAFDASVIINPNKNENISFSKDDLFIVID